MEGSCMDSENNFEKPKYVERWCFEYSNSILALHDSHMSSVTLRRFLYSHLSKVCFQHTWKEDNMCANFISNEEHRLGTN